jgi:hypothetical protein
MSNILIVDLTASEPDANEYQFMRSTRNKKYYKRIAADPNAMDVQQIATASNEMLDAFENAFANMCITGGKRKSRKTKRRMNKKRRTSKSRKH